jgi:hypothetical protein
VPWRANIARMKTSDNELETVLDAVAGYFAVLAEPTRLRILRALCRGRVRRAASGKAALVQARPS